MADDDGEVVAAARFRRPTAVVAVACLAILAAGARHYLSKTCLLKLPPLPPEAFAPYVYNGERITARRTIPGRRLRLPRNVTVHQVYHVTKEFGPASMGGLGTMLTALVSAQMKHMWPPNPYVIIPHYSYLDALASNSTRVSISPCAPLSIPYFPRRLGGLLGPRTRRSLEVQVSTMTWTVGYESASGYSDVEHPDHVFQDHPGGPRYRKGGTRDTSKITVFLIGRGSRHPFEDAFVASDPHDIYSTPPPLTYELKNLYFAKAAAALLLRIEQGAPIRNAAVAHLHGATNSLVTCLLRELSHDYAGARLPVVYTLHDYLDEVEYSNLYSNLYTFVDPASCPLGASWRQSYLSPSPSSACGRFFPSSLAIGLSNVASFVSSTMASLLPSPSDFPFASNSRVVGALRAKNEAGAWTGVTNGLDFGDKDDGRNPFLSEVLAGIGATFPPLSSTDEEAAGAFKEAKATARRWLVEHRPDILPPRAVDGPVILFVGRFQWDKGCELFDDLVSRLHSATVLGSPEGGHFIALGTRNNYPHRRLVDLASRFPTVFSLVDDPTLQPSLGPVLRMAADFAFVPSFAESFGLVAAEGLLFGSAVVSSGVGGLREFLREDDGGAPPGNAYLFDVRREEDGKGGRKEVTAWTRAECVAAVDRAIEAWRVRREKGTEEGFARRMVRCTDGMRWGRTDGPVDQYARVYERAAELARSDRST